MNAPILLVLMTSLVVVCIWLLVSQAMKHASTQRKLTEGEPGIDKVHLVRKPTEAETAAIRSAVVKQQKRAARQRRAQ